MIYSAHQPNYFPYLGLFYKIYKSDIFIFLDDVQFTKSSGPAHERNIISRDQKTAYLKVPIKYSFKSPINKVKISNSIMWTESHLSLMEEFYYDAPFFEKIIEKIKPILCAEYSNLADLNIALIKAICNNAGINRTFFNSSEFQIKSSKTERLIELGKLVGGTEYYSGTGATVYLNTEIMKRAGINPVYSDYRNAIYLKNGKECQKNMSVLDYLFYYGFDFSHLGW